MQFEKTTIENLLQELSQIHPQAVIALNFDDEEITLFNKQ
jgi:sulfur carrier protein ThiS